MHSCAPLIFTNVQMYTAWQKFVVYSQISNKQKYTKNVKSRNFRMRKIKFWPLTLQAKNLLQDCSHFCYLCFFAVFFLLIAQLAPELFVPETTLEKLEVIPQSRKIGRSAVFGIIWDTGPRDCVGSVERASVWSYLLVRISGCDWLPGWDFLEFESIPSGLEFGGRIGGSSGFLKR